MVFPHANPSGAVQMGTDPQRKGWRQRTMGRIAVAWLWSDATSPTTRCPIGVVGSLLPAADLRVGSTLANPSPSLGRLGTLVFLLSLEKTANTRDTRSWVRGQVRSSGSRRGPSSGSIATSVRPVSYT